MFLNDVSVSVRMPKSMVDELKALAKEHYFLDLSEEIRSIVRQEWIKHTSPELFQLKKMRESIEKEIKMKSRMRIQQEVNKELEKIRMQLKKEGFIGK
jgi:Arc/MetJ-type ribon-helix-helix transcriptional regulator